MRRVLLLGAGLVSRPLVRYLLEVAGCELTVASRTVSKAEALIDGHPEGRALSLNVRDEPDALEAQIAACDVAISLLPYTLHMRVAELCLAHGKHLVTTSYVSPAMRSLDGAAREAGLLFLNEIGVDPGIDHMSAMQIIDDVQSEGLRVDAFYSFCGGLPSPASNDNPLGYKFSWSPRGVILAGRNTARFLEEGEVKEIPGEALFGSHRVGEVEALGALEVYPNRDSTPYAALYGLEEAETLIRGTYRNRGWCETFQRLAELGALSDAPRPALEGRSYANWMASLAGAEPDADVEAAVAARLDLTVEHPVMERLRWLELFSGDAIEAEALTSLDILCARMQRKMGYAEGETDMIVMQHEFFVSDPSGSRPDERIISTLIEHGEPDGDSAMARTVALPAAIATRLLLEGRFSVRGVQIPNIAEIYTPVMDELESMGVTFTERRAPLHDV